MRYLFILVMLICNPVAYANLIVCPSVEEIKIGLFNQWLPLYIDNEELAFENDVNNFKTQVKEFDYAKWDTSYQETGHCFYKGDHPILSKITFANDAWRPNPTQAWVWIKPNISAECHSADVNDCLFIA